MSSYSSSSRASSWLSYTISKMRLEMAGLKDELRTTRPTPQRAYNIKKVLKTKASFYESLLAIESLEEKVEQELDALRSQKRNEDEKGAKQNGWKLEATNDTLNLRNELKEFLDLSITTLETLLYHRREEGIKEEKEEKVDVEDLLSDNPKNSSDLDVGTRRLLSIVYDLTEENQFLLESLNEQFEDVAEKELLIHNAKELLEIQGGERVEEEESEDEDEEEEGYYDTNERKKKKKKKKGNVKKNVDPKVSGALARLKIRETVSDLNDVYPWVLTQGSLVSRFLPPRGTRADEEGLRLSNVPELDFVFLCLAAQYEFVLNARKNVRRKKHTTDTESAGESEEGDAGKGRVKSRSLALRRSMVDFVHRAQKGKLDVNSVVALYELSGSLPRVMNDEANGVPLSEEVSAFARLVRSITSSLYWEEEGGEEEEEEEREGAKGGGGGGRGVRSNGAARKARVKPNPILIVKEAEREDPTRTFEQLNDIVTDLMADKVKINSVLESMLSRIQLGGEPLLGVVSPAGGRGEINTRDALRKLYAAFLFLVDRSNEVQRLSKTVSDYEQSHKNLEERAEELQRELEDKEKILSDGNDLERREKQIQERQAVFKQRLEEFLVKREAVKAKETEVAKREEKVREESEDVVRREEELYAGQRELEALLKKVNEERQLLEASQATAYDPKQMEEDMMNFASENAELANRVRDEKERVSELEKALSRVRSERESARKELENQKATARSLRDRAEQWDLIEPELRRALKEAEEALELEKKHNDDLKRSLESERRNKGAKADEKEEEEREREREDEKEREQRLRLLEDQLEEAERRLETLKKQEEDAKARVQKAGRDSNLVESNSRKTLESVQGELASLARQRSAAAKDLEEILDKTKEYQRKWDDLNEKIEAEADKRDKEADASTEALKKENEELRERVKTLEKQNEEILLLAEVNAQLVQTDEEGRRSQNGSESGEDQDEGEEEEEEGETSDNDREKEEAEAEESGSDVEVVIPPPKGGSSSSSTSTTTTTPTQPPKPSSSSDFDYKSPLSRVLPTILNTKKEHLLGNGVPDELSVDLPSLLTKLLGEEFYEQHDADPPLYLASEASEFLHYKLYDKFYENYPTGRGSSSQRVDASVALNTMMERLAAQKLEKGETSLRALLVLWDHVMFGFGTLRSSKRKLLLESRKAVKESGYAQFDAKRFAYGTKFEENVDDYTVVLMYHNALKFVLPIVRYLSDTDSNWGEGNPIPLNEGNLNDATEFLVYAVCFLINAQQGKLGFQLQLWQEDNNDRTWPLFFSSGKTKTDGSLFSAFALFGTAQGFADLLNNPATLVGLSVEDMVRRDYVRTGEADPAWYLSPEERAKEELSKRESNYESCAKAMRKSNNKDDVGPGFEPNNTKNWINTITKTNFFGGTAKLEEPYDTRRTITRDLVDNQRVKDELIHWLSHALKYLLRSALSMIRDEGGNAYARQATVLTSLVDLLEKKEKQQALSIQDFEPFRVQAPGVTKVATVVPIKVPSFLL